MRSGTAAIMVVSLLGCHARSPTPPVNPSAPPVTEAATIELPRILGSERGDSIVAWEGGMPVGHRTRLCVLRIAGRSAQCTTPAGESDASGDFTIVGVSSSLRWLALKVGEQLRFYETEDLRVVAMVQLAEAEGEHVEFDAGETRAVWMLGNTPRIMMLANRELSAAPALAEAGPGSRVRWVTKDRLLVWGPGHAPIVVNGDGAYESVKLPATAWAGSSVDQRGERVSFATSSGLVAVFEPLRANEVKVLRSPVNDGRFRLRSVELDAGGRRVLAVRGDGRSTEIGLFDVAGEVRVLSTPGSPMFAGFSGDGSRVAWSNTDELGDAAGGALFPSFTTSAEKRDDLAHSLEDVFLGWSGSRMLVLGEVGACLREGGRSVYCRDQSWVPYPETHRAGDVLWVGGDHLLRADGKERRVSELYVTGTVEQPVLNVVEHQLEPAREEQEARTVQGAVEGTLQAQ